MISKFDYKKKALKKAWLKIAILSVSRNMVQVESLIDEIVLDTFGLRDLGVLEVSFTNEKMKRIYGASNYSSFEYLKLVRQANLEKYGTFLRGWLMNFIPERLHSSIMYKQMMFKIN